MRIATVERVIKYDLDEPVLRRRSDWYVAKFSQWTGEGPTEDATLKSLLEHMGGK
jgi:hypothetical protein